MKKLIPALCLLLVSAVLLGTSTYAWFSMNTKVTASTAIVKATASKNLLISKESDANYGPSISLGTQLETLVPTSTSGGASPVFYKLDETGTEMSADSYAYGTGSTGGKPSSFTTAVAATDFDATTGDYIDQTWYIKSTGEDATNLKAFITATTDGTKALDPALRVGLLAGGTFYIYEPVSGATTAYKGIASLTDYTYDPDEEVDDDEVTLQVPVLNTANQTITTDGSVLLSALTADEPYAIHAYIWYEGQDQACKSTNAVDLGKTTFSFTFTVEG